MDRADDARARIGLGQNSIVADRFALHLDQVRFGATEFDAQAVSIAGLVACRARLPNPCIESRCRVRASVSLHRSSRVEQPFRNLQCSGRQGHRRTLVRICADIYGPVALPVRTFPPAFQVVPS
jgi:hypothetical protein